VEDEILSWQSTCDGIDGCVVVVAVVRGDNVTIGNVGDCRALKIHCEGEEGANYQQLSTDHSPENPL